MSVKLIAFDLDGTTLINHRGIPNENLVAMKKACEKGIYLVPATGRIASFLPKELLENDFIKYAITSNGGSIYNIKTMECLHKAYINSDTAVEVSKIIEKFDLYNEYYVEGQAYTVTCELDFAMKKYGIPEEKRYFLSKGYAYFNDIKEFLKTPNIAFEKINLPFIPEKNRTEIRNIFEKMPLISVCSSIPDNLEINSSLAGKGKGLLKLCEILNIDPSECMTIGDGENDVSMLEVAGVSVAMGNSCDEALKSAKFKTTNCNDFGFAKAVYDYAL